MNYNIIPSSRKVRRSFAITAGLREGYTGGALVHDLSEAVAVVHQWMRVRAIVGLPFLTGSFTQEVLVYTWKGATEGNDMPEPAAIFHGKVYNSDLPDERVIQMLTELASHLGRTLRQTRVYVTYHDWAWVMLAKSEFSPREAKSVS